MPCSHPSNIVGSDDVIEMAKGTPLRNITNQYNICTRTAIRYKQTYESEKRLTRKKYVRKPILKPSDLEGLERYVSENAFSILSDLKEDSNLTASLPTISLALKSLNFSSRVCPKKFRAHNARIPVGLGATSLKM